MSGDRRPPHVVADGDVVTPLGEGSYDGQVRCEVLGRLRVIDARGRRGDGGVGLGLGGARQQLVLAMLLAEANSVVSTDAIVDGLWGNSPPSAPRHTAQGYVSERRKLLGPVITYGMFRLLREAASDGDYWAKGPDQHLQMWILDVEGVRLVIGAGYFPDTAPQDRADLDEIIKLDPDRMTLAALGTIATPRQRVGTDDDTADDANYQPRIGNGEGQATQGKAIAVTPNTGRAANSSRCTATCSG